MPKPPLGSRLCLETQAIDRMYRCHDKSSQECFHIVLRYYSQRPLHGGSPGLRPRPLHITRSVHTMKSIDRTSIKHTTTQPYQPTTVMSTSTSMSHQPSPRREGTESRRRTSVPIHHEPHPRRQDSLRSLNNRKPPNATPPLDPNPLDTNITTPHPVPISCGLCPKRVSARVKHYI